MKKLELQEMHQISGGLKVSPSRSLILPTLDYELGPHAHTLPNINERRFWLP
ncbi:MAG: hypothetical protein H6558_07805 [Lewinellaceae bacterium]|nr:hypothetical protein [Lewinellaceae bacterium]MCB9291056.1 hypothetical protein [Lewinellaceae bacterium]